MLKNNAWQSFKINVDISQRRNIINTVIAPYFNILRDLPDPPGRYFQIGDGSLIISTTSTVDQNSIISALLSEVHLKNVPGEGLLRQNMFSEIDFLFHNFRCYANPLEFYFHNKSSDLLIDMFAQTDNNDQSLFYFSLYLHFAWIKTRMEINQEKISSVLLKGYCWFTLKNDHSTLNKLKELYEVDKKLVDDIYLYINDSNLSGLNDSQLQPWVVSFREILIENLSLYFNKEYLNELSFYIIPRLINKQLGISEERSLLQMYYINQAVLYAIRSR